MTVDLKEVPRLHGQPQLAASDFVLTSGALFMRVGTCKSVRHIVAVPGSDASIEFYECSECGERMFSDYKVCPSCCSVIEAIEEGE